MEETYIINPTFKRIISIAKNTGKAVSDLLGIKDRYCAFCLDETAEYLYFKLKSNAKNRDDLASLMSKYSVKKRK